MADNLGIALTTHDIDESDAALQELLEKGGKKQVPFLVDSEKNISMYESSDIIDHLRDNYAKSAISTETVKQRIHVGGSTCVSCEG